VIGYEKKKKKKKKKNEEESATGTWREFHLVTRTMESSRRTRIAGSILKTRETHGCFIVNRRRRAPRSYFLSF
jgi:hypothetical protein